MSDERNLIALVVADATVQSLVGSKIYYMPAPQDAEPPFITYHVVATVPTTRINGTVQSDWLIVQIDCYARETATVKATANAVRGALQGAAGVREITGVRDFYEPDVDMRRVSIDVSYNAQK